jgi:hypothetical protein
MRGEHERSSNRESGRQRKGQVIRPRWLMEKFKEGRGPAQFRLKAPERTVKCKTTHKKQGSRNVVAE